MTVVSRAVVITERAEARMTVLVEELQEHSGGT
jgi:hypothetical protein